MGSHGRASRMPGSDDLGQPCARMTTCISVIRVGINVGLLAFDINMTGCGGLMARRIECRMLDDLGQPCGHI